MDSTRKSNKIRDIVRLQQILKKWKKLAALNRSNGSSSGSTTSSTTSSSGKSINRFLKKTLSFSESSLSSASGGNAVVPKGYIAVCVGKEQKRFVIPTDYLKHQVFGILLREAEEEFGFQKEGVLKFPCKVHLFEKILKMMEDKGPSSSSSSSSLLLQDEFGFLGDHHDLSVATCANNCSPDSSHDQLISSHHHPQMCR